MKWKALSTASLATLLLILFLPVFSSVILFGNNMNYNPAHKIYASVGNKVLLALVLLVGGLFLLLIFCLRKIAYTRYTVWGCIIFSLIVSVIFYAVSVEVSKCIAFYGGWDCGMVANSARWVYEGQGMQYGDYYSIFTNNVPITWLLHELYSYSAQAPFYPYNPEFIWIQFQCVQHALSVFLSAMTVLLVSKNVSCCVLTALVNAVFLGLSPWKVIPYTDASTIAFPVAVIFLYALFLRQKSKWRYAIWLLMAFTGCLGGVMKATCYVALIAVVCIDFWWNCLEKEKIIMKIKRFSGRMLLLVCACFLVSCCREGMYRALDYEYDARMDMGWIPFLYDGLNEETTGACAEDGLEMVRARGESRKEADAHEWDMVMERVREKGFKGLLDFWHRKQVMTYNDGTFSWYQEGFFNAWEYEKLTDSKWQEPLRDFYWKDGRYYEVFVTFSHGIWFFVLVGVLAYAVMVLCSAVLTIRKKREEVSNDMMISAVMILHFVGIFLFLMLFEGRARYLYNSIAVFAVMAVMGYHKTVEVLQDFVSFWHKRNISKKANLP